MDGITYDPECLGDDYAIVVNPMIAVIPDEYAVRPFKQQLAHPPTDAELDEWVRTGDDIPATPQDL